MYDLNPLISGYLHEHKHVLSADEHEKLLTMIKEGNHEARDALIEDNLGLVAFAAASYRKCGMDFDDLFQEGCLALMNAIDQCKLGMNNHFSTYACSKIKWGISRSIINKNSLIRKPLHVKELYYKLARIQTQLMCVYGREPTIEELAAEVDVSEEKVRYALRSAEEPLSLEYEYGEEGDYYSLEERIADPCEPDPASIILGNYVAEDVRNAVLTCLTPKELRIIRHRFGFDGCEILSLHQIGKVLGISRERVRQIENNAKYKIKRELHRRGYSRDSFF